MSERESFYDVDRIPRAVDDSTDFGRALKHGKLVATVEGTTGHITVRLTAKAKVAGKWRVTMFENATRVFLDVPSASGDFADKIATYYPPNAEKYAGMLFRDRGQTDDRRWKAGAYVLRAALGLVDGRHCQQASHCLRCGAELRHGDSIAMNFGPDCANEVGLNGNRSGTDAAPHEAKQRDRKPLERTGETDVPVEPENMPARVERSTSTVLELVDLVGDEPTKPTAQTEVRKTFTLTADDDPRAILARLNEGS